MILRIVRFLTVLVLCSPILALVISTEAGAQTIFNCPSGFVNVTTSPCGASAYGQYGRSYPFQGVDGVSSLVGSQIQIVPVINSHAAFAESWSPSAVNVQAFKSTFTFNPNGYWFGFTLNNCTTLYACGGIDGWDFVAGAGQESGFFQHCCGTPIQAVDNIFALEFDGWSGLQWLTSFSYSSVQIYQTGQSPINPPYGLGADYYNTTKISTYPVPLNSPATTQASPSSDTFSATVIYTGTDFILNMYDVTAGGSCPGASCFTYTWQGVNIPGIVGGDTAWVSFTAGMNGISGSSVPLNLNSWSYTVLSPASIPTFSPIAGTYAGTQSVTISDSSSGAVICYNTTGAPATNGSTGCANGTLYTGAISVPSGQTLYAVAGGTGYGDSPVGSAGYKIGSTAAQPTFLPASGVYQGDQTVFLSAAQGGVICYNTTGSPATNGSTGCATGTLYTGPITVTSNETIYAVAGGTGYGSDSPVGSSTYTISPFGSLGESGCTYNQCANPANSPTFSPLPGTYTGTQNVTISSTTSGSYICYLVSSTPPAILPQTDNGWNGATSGCTVGTVYTGPVAVSSTSTIYAIATTALYSGVPGPPSSVSQASYTINPAVSGTTSAALSSSQNPSVYGQSVTLTATLTGSSSAPTGSVTFVNGSASIGNATLVPGGGLTSTATLTTSALPAGTNPIVVTYGSTSSPTLNEVVNQGAAAATVASSLSSTVYGQANTLTATLTGLYAAPTGPVVFMDGATTIATVSLTAGAGLSSTAALTTSTLPVGTHAITVSYAATTNFGAATSPVLSQVVNPSATTGTVTSTLTPSSFGQSVTLVATVSSSYAAPTGSVTFMDGSTAIGSATLTPGGGLSSSASLNTSALPLGTDSITVVYGATANFGGSTSAVLTQVVKPPSTTSTVVSSVNPASIGQSVTLTATVSSGSAAPTGSVTFMDGSTAIGTATLTPGSGLSSTATLTISTLPTGTDAITVVYAATANFGGSTSAVLNQIVNPATTTAAIASSLNPAGSGQSVTFTATVSSGYAAPIGSVTFKNGATSIGTATLSPGSGLSSTATLAVTTLPGGTSSITVVYAATPNFGASTSAVLSQVVNAPATTATVVSSLNPSSYDQPVTFTATLSSSNAAPTGSVTFMQGATAIGTGTLASSGGLSSTATLIASTLPVGTDPITVVYAATPNFGASTSAVLSQVVNPASTAATVTSSLNPSSSSQPVILTATLSSGYAAPTGSVTFMEGSTAIGSAALTASGALSSDATLITSTLPVGSDPITAVYAVTPNFGAATSAVFSQVVNPATSTTATVTSSLNPASAGQSVILTATLVGLFAPPTGSVVFMDGSTTIGSGTLTATGTLTSTATLVISALPVGTDPITAVYAATPNFGAATSAVFSEVINPSSTTASVTSSVSPASVGQSVIFTATISSSSAAPTGSVTFMDGSTPIGTATLVAGSGLSSTASLATSALPVGTDSITAVYAATPNFGAATSAPFSETVTGLISATALSASPNPASVGQTVILSAAVGGSSTTPSGTVTFYYGTTSLGSGTLGASGNASITTTALPVGTDTLTAVFSGSAIYSASTSPTVSESIQAAASQDFTVALASPSVTIATENNTTTSVAISSVNGFADTVNLSCGSLPTYITCSLTPSAASLAANGAASSVLYIDTSSVLGYARNNSGPLDPGGPPFNLALMLSPMGLFAGIAAFPTRRSRRFPRLRLLLLLLAAIPVTLAFSGCASPTVISAGGTPLSAAAGTYTIPITATGSSTKISHTVNLTLTVTP